MAANGDGNKSIWITEYGWRLWRGEPDPENYVPDEATQASRVEDALNRFRHPNHCYITQASLHLIADTPAETWGICDGSLNPRPAFYRFQAMAPEWLSLVSAIRMV